MRSWARGTASRCPALPARGTASCWTWWAARGTTSSLGCGGGRGPSLELGWGMRRSITSSPWCVRCSVVRSAALLESSCALKGNAQFRIP
ncbi:UNVERIFIED_CONTAM: hypothetical protein Sangu_2238600 [Sesamum angustifolium]|uniref:Secreted protein n=1 Tax=Sesamum angustifolium TaxID=2727405 RepID=A0AAW2L646_9LAMI